MLIRDLRNCDFLSKLDNILVFWSKYTSAHLSGSWPSNTQMQSFPYRLKSKKYFLFIYTTFLHPSFNYAVRRAYGIM